MFTFGVVHARHAISGVVIAGTVHKVLAMSVDFADDAFSLDAADASVSHVLTGRVIRRSARNALMVEALRKFPIPTVVIDHTNVVAPIAFVFKRIADFIIFAIARLARVIISTSPVFRTVAIPSALNAGKGISVAERLAFEGADRAALSIST